MAILLIPIADAILMASTVISGEATEKKIAEKLFVKSNALSILDKQLKAVRSESNME